MELMVVSGRGSLWTLPRVHYEPWAFEEFGIDSVYRSGPMSAFGSVDFCFD